MLTSRNPGFAAIFSLFFVLIALVSGVQAAPNDSTTRLSLAASDRPAFEKRMAELKALVPAAELAGN